MASIAKRATTSGVRYDVRYRGTDKRTRTKTFGRKVDADRFAREVETDIARGDWLDPKAGRETFATVAAAWLDVADVKASTRAGYASVLTKHLLPAFGTTPIANITTPEIEKYLAKLRKTPTSRKGDKLTSPGTVRNVRNTLSAVCRYAVRAGMLRSNPVTDTVAPKTAARPEMKFLDAAQVTELADATDDRYRLAVLLDAYTGLRAGELWALKVGRVDLMRRRLTVAESIAEVHGEQITSAPKNGKTRTVPIPKFLVSALSEHLAPIAEDPDAYVFTAPHGGPVRHSTFYDRYFQPATVAVGLEGLRFHDLRHTAVSFMIAAGASPLVISRAIGHGSITVTYDTYGHVLPDHADDLADALDAIYEAREAPQSATVRAMPAR